MKQELLLKNEKTDSLVGSMTLGPEKATILERFVTAFHIPFYLGCLLLAFIFGPPGAILSVYVQTNNLYEAVARTVCLFFGMQLPVWHGVAGLCLLLVILFYFLYMIRYMRLKLVAIEPLLLSLLPEGEETFHKVFGGVSRLGPPIVIDLILIVFFFFQVVLEVPVNFVVFGTAPANLGYLVVSFPLWFLIFGTFAWVYFSSIRGLHILGKKPLKLKSIYEDRMLGVRPIGSLSLSFAFTYFVGLIILTLVPIVVWPNPLSPSYIGLLSVLTLLGVIFFFLPLNTIHKKMLDVKHREQEALRKQFSRAIQKQTESRTQVSESSLSVIREVLIRLTTVLTIDISKKEVAAIPTWPFDAPIISRLAAMIFSIIAILIANFIKQQLLSLFF